MIFLNIGSNLNSKFGNRFDNIYQTLNLLKLENLKILKISDFYETPSYPNNKNPKFINIAVQIECDITPLELLKILKNIEKKMDRILTLKNEPRTCDIDIIDFKGLIIQNNKITLPHPRAHNRNFVLYPLMQICPNWTHPESNKKIEFLIKNLSIKTRNEITRMKESAIIKK